MFVLGEIDEPPGLEDEFSHDGRQKGTDKKSKIKFIQKYCGSFSR